MKKNICILLLVIGVIATIFFSIGKAWRIWIPSVAEIELEIEDNGTYTFTDQKMIKNLVRQARKFDFTYYSRRLKLAKHTLRFRIIYHNSKEKILIYHIDIMDFRYPEIMLK